MKLALTSLTLYWAKNVSAIQLAESCPNLQSLIISGECNGIQDALETIFTGCKNLEHIEVQQNKYSEAVLRAVTQLPKLKKFIGSFTLVQDVKRYLTNVPISQYDF
jgi:hypothetical protein